MLEVYLYVLATVTSTVALILTIIFILLGGYYEIQKRRIANSEIALVSENINAITTCFLILLGVSLAMTYGVKTFLL